MGKDTEIRIKKVIKLFIVFIVIIIVAILLMLQQTPLLNEQKGISPQEMKTARASIKEVADKFTSYHQFVEFDINRQELEAISKLGTHLLPKTRVNINASELGIVISSTTEIKYFFTRYVNIACWLFEEDDAVMYIDKCTIGNISVSGWLVQKFFVYSLTALFNEQVANTIEQLITSSSYKDKAIVFSAQKSKYFKENINSSLKSIGDLASIYTQSGDVSPEVVRLYVDEIDTTESSELSEYIKVLFTLAKKRSFDHDAEDESRAIIWALAVSFGDYRFGRLIGVKVNKASKSIPLLRGRKDLSQHFIYSAALHQLSDSKIGLNIGEAKELLDSVSGGSGYSFADLAADKAGITFAKYITADNHNATHTLNVLNNIKNENAFFPFVHDLPQGFTGNNFKRVIQSTNSDSYKEIEGEIDKRLKQLSLYKQVEQNERNIDIWSKPVKSDISKHWVTVDTHIHTKFSDGSKEVEEIAAKAYQHGCDAIAITDHGDYNLKKVTSDEYFETIERVNNRFPTLTIIPGLEWNIPPMNGREHVTVLLPKTKNLSRNLSAFRARYDHFNQFDNKFLSPKPAFNWLNKYGIEQDDKAVVMYNHPSRKDYQTMENKHDIVYWRNFSNLVVGFSGAPGHQKKRESNNGSYERHLKTINGWDPAVATIGGEWDQLLQQGYKIWAARAASDFHNTQMDYWPCQFSTTHLFTHSNQHNNVLAAFHSGAYWAQHGKFVQNINFNVKTHNNILNLGQFGRVQSDQSNITINLSVALNELDWQGYPTSLDDLELVIITPSKVSTIPFYDLTLINNKLDISYQYKLNSDFAIFRWRGKSIQPEQHQYMFYTNPIKIIRAY
jgi:hypothetical protein